MSHSQGHAAPPPAQGLPSRVNVPPARLILTLAAAGAMAGLLIVTVFQWAQPRIQTYQAEVLRAAVAEVLEEPARTERFFIHEGALVSELPQGGDTLRAERTFLGYDHSGAAIGYAITGAQPGFVDLVHVIFGYNPQTGRVLGMKVLDSRETPGLGDAIQKDQNFVSRFEGALAPLVGVKTGRSTGEEHEVVMITGATISSRTVIAVINTRVEQLHPILQSHWPGGAP